MPLVISYQVCLYIYWKIRNDIIYCLQVAPVWSEPTLAEPVADSQGESHRVITMAITHSRVSNDRIAPNCFYVFLKVSAVFKFKPFKVIH